MRFEQRVNQILEQIGSVPPPPPAIIQKAEDNSLSFTDIFNFIKQHEGYRPAVYMDTVGKPTVGIGLNLKRQDAPAIVTSAGANYQNVLNGTQQLTDEQIKSIFKTTIAIAYADAKKYIPKYDSLPKNIKLAILDLSFNLGYTNLSKFVKLKQAIERNDYKSAAGELTNSKWATQVGNRAKNLINLFLTS